MRQLERRRFLQMVVQQPGVVDQGQQDQRLAPRQRTAEELALRLIQPELDLCERAPENQNQAQPEQDDGEFDRGEELIDSCQHVSISRLARTG